MFSFWKQPEEEAPELSKDDLEQMISFQNQHAHPTGPEETDQKGSIQIWQPEKSEDAEKDDSVDEIERLYQQALDKMETVEQEIGLDSTDQVVTERVKIQLEDVNDNLLTGQQSSSVSENDIFNVHQNKESITPEQILEAVLFVGGASLTTKKIRLLLQEEFDNDFIESTISQLNTRYSLENRPYEILFGEGGYRMTLRQEYERVRIRTFGMGPKEVKLSLDALEMLAVVAYKQPITKKEIESLGKQKPGGTLNQLLRREIISLERDSENPKVVKYQTTQRFLQLFGLKNLAELPTAEDLEFK